MISTSMTPPSLVDAMVRSDVKWFSAHVLAMDFGKLKGIVYPHPHYKSFLIKKRNGDPRVINEPRLALKHVQHLILNFLEGKAGPIKPAVHGFVRQRSILTNARRHCSAVVK